MFGGLGIIAIFLFLIGYVLYFLLCAAFALKYLPDHETAQQKADTKARLEREYDKFINQPVINIRYTDKPVRVVVGMNKTRTHWKLDDGSLMEKGLASLVADNPLYRVQYRSWLLQKRGSQQ